MATGNTLNVSSIFKWYGGDFEQGFQEANTLHPFLAQYADALKLLPAQQAALQHTDMKIKS